MPLLGQLDQLSTISLIFREFMLILYHSIPQRYRHKTSSKEIKIKNKTKTYPEETTKLATGFS